MSTIMIRKGLIMHPEKNWKRFKKHNPSIAPIYRILIKGSKKDGELIEIVEIKAAFISKYNSKRVKLAISLTFSDDERWHYLAVIIFTCK